MSELPNGLTRDARDPLPFHCVRSDEFDAWRKLQLPATGQWLDAQKYVAGSGTLTLLPGERGVDGAVVGIGDRLDPFAYAHAPHALPPGDWKLASELDAGAHRALLLGWGLGSYRFRRYKQPLREPAKLVIDGSADAETLDILAACLKVRDLVNTPTEHMGPDELEAEVRAIAERHGAEGEVIAGDALIEAGSRNGCL